MLSVLNFITNISSDNRLKNSNFIRKFASIHVSKLYRNIFDKPKTLNCLFFFFFCFLGPHLWPMEVPRLEVELELQLPAYARATATLDLSLVCDLHHSSQKHRIPDPLSKARDRTCLLMDTSQICFCCPTMGLPKLSNFLNSTDLYT